MTMTDQEVLCAYEAMLALTEQMVAAAANAEWEALETLEKQVGDHVLRLQANERQVVLEDGSRLKKVAIIKQLLDYDRKIRDLTLPWMAQLSQLINSSGTARRLSNAYLRA